jgi:hypothetical protein
MAADVHLPHAVHAALALKLLPQLLTSHCTTLHMVAALLAVDSTQRGDPPTSSSAPPFASSCTTSSTSLTISLFDALFYNEAAVSVVPTVVHQHEFLEQHEWPSLAEPPPVAAVRRKSPFPAGFKGKWISLDDRSDTKIIRPSGPSVVPVDFPRLLESSLATPTTSTSSAASSAFLEVQFVFLKQNDLFALACARRWHAPTPQALVSASPPESMDEEARHVPRGDPGTQFGCSPEIILKQIAREYRWAPDHVKQERASPSFVKALRDFLEK